MGLPLGSHLYTYIKAQKKEPSMEIAESLEITRMQIAQAAILVLLVQAYV